MKNMNFILKGLIKAGFMTVLLFVGHSVVAQDATSELAYSFSTSKDALSLDNAVLVGSTEAIDILNGQAAIYRDQITNAGNDATVAANAKFKMTYLRHLVGEIQANGKTVYSALATSGGFLMTSYNSYDSSILTTTPSEAYQEALDLVGN